MRASILIPTYNCQKHCGFLVDLFKNKPQDFEIIIVDSSSNDDSENTLKPHVDQWITIKNEDFSHGKTRNFLAEKANAPILIFMTQDCEPCSWASFNFLIEPIEQENVSGVYGKQCPKSDASPLEYFQRLLSYHDQKEIRDMHSVSNAPHRFFFSNSFSAIKKSDFKEVGGFASNLIVNEDMKFCSKLLNNGKKVCYQPQAICVHSHTYTLWERFQRFFDVGVFLSSQNAIQKAAKTNNNIKPKIVKNILNSQISPYKHLHSKCYGIWECAFSFFGLKAGLMHKFFPLTIKKIVLSAQKQYW
jgi:rhamnosyltransferase